MSEDVVPEKALKVILSDINGLKSEIEELVSNIKDATGSDRRGHIEIIRKFYPILDRSNFNNLVDEVEKQRKELESFNLTSEDIVTIYCTEKCKETGKNMGKAIEALREVIYKVSRDLKAKDRDQKVNIAAYKELVLKDAENIDEVISKVEDINQDCYDKLENSKKAAEAFKIQKWIDNSRALEERVEKIEKHIEHLESEVANLEVEFTS